MEGGGSRSTGKQEEYRRGGDGVSTRLKKGCLSTFVSFQQGLVYVNSFFVRQGKKLTARSEEELTAADLEATKMQVEAADAAEDAKNRIHKS